MALARALAPNPSLLLLDEPFSNLDVQTRVRLASELRALLLQTGTTVLLVTHDQAEAFALADRVGVMERGRLLQWDAAPELYRHPSAPGVATLVGRGVLVPGEAVGESADVQVLVRPEQVRLDAEGPLHGVLVDVTFRGPGHVGRVQLEGGPVIEIELREAPLPAKGASVRLAFREGPLPRFPAR